MILCNPQPGIGWNGGRKIMKKVNKGAVVGLVIGIIIAVFGVVQYFGADAAFEQSKADSY